jgi:hypothetical protein
MLDLLYLDRVGNLVWYGGTHSARHVGPFPSTPWLPITYAMYSPADIVGGDVNKLRRMDATVVSLPQNFHACRP